MGVYEWELRVYIAEVYGVCMRVENREREACSV